MFVCMYVYACYDMRRKIILFHENLTHSLIPHLPNFQTSDVQ